MIKTKMKTRKKTTEELNQQFQYDLQKFLKSIRIEISNNEIEEVTENFQRLIISYEIMKDSIFTNTSMLLDKVFNDLPSEIKKNLEQKIQEKYV